MDLLTSKGVEHTEIQAGRLGRRQQYPAAGRRPPGPLRTAPSGWRPRSDRACKEPATGLPASRTARAGAPRITSGGAALSRGLVPQSPIKQRALQRVEARQQCGNLGQERIGQDRRHLLFATAARIPHQLADVDFQARPPAARANRAWELLCRFRFWRCRCAGPACGWPVDAGSGGALCGCPVPGQPRAGRLPPTSEPRGWARGCGPSTIGLLDIEGLVAFSAKGIAGPVLHQGAVFAAHDFASLNTHKSCGHGLFAERQSGASGALFSTTTMCYFEGDEP